MVFSPFLSFLDNFPHIQFGVRPLWFSTLQLLIHIFICTAAPGLLQLFPSVQVTKFDLDHQRLVFTPHYKFLAWRSANLSCTLFRMNASTCGGSVIHKWQEGTIQGTQINITSKNTSSNQECLNFFKINAVSQRNGPLCQEMQQSFQINKSGTILLQCSLIKTCSGKKKTLHQAFPFIYHNVIILCTTQFHAQYYYCTELNMFHNDLINFLIRVKFSHCIFP